MPDGPGRGRLSPSGSLAHVGVTQVEVGDDPVAAFEAEEVTHVLVVGDGTGSPDGGEAQSVGRQLHVLDGGGAGSIVLERLHLVAAALGDHRYHYRSSEGLLALATYTSGHELLFFALGLG